MCLNCATGLSNLESYEASLDSDYTKSINGRMGGRSYWNFEVEKALSNVITRLIESGQVLSDDLVFGFAHFYIDDACRDALKVSSSKAVGTCRRPITKSFLGDIHRTAPTKEESHYNYQTTYYFYLLDCCKKVGSG